MAAIILHAAPRVGAATRTTSLLLVLALAVMSACVPARPTPTAPRNIPPILPEPERVSGEVGGLLGAEVLPVREDLLGPVEYDLPVEANNWVAAEVDFLVNERRDVVDRWLERGEFYRPFVEQVFREHGIPADLYHLGMIESGFIPVARSRAGAVGVWQFMPATGTEVGLRVDREVDERMDPVRSTRAAARHLRSLFRAYGDWTLAAAAYNAGSGRITRGLQRFGATGFWDLAQRGDLAEETRRYVPRLFAMAIIGKNRERYGFAAPAESGFAFDSIHVEYAVPLDQLAGLGDLGGEELTALNPHLLSRTTPTGGYWIWVPAGEGVAMQRAWLASDLRSAQGLTEYVVRWGDTLGHLARDSGVGAARIRELNPGVDFDRLRTGETIRLPGQAVSLLAQRDNEAAPERLAAGATPRASEEGERVREVRAGDTLWEIAREYGLTVEELQRANSLSGTVVRPGQRLVLPGGEQRSESPVPEELASLEHVVESGDTLWEIARRYGSTVDAIERANGLGNRPIRPGQTLTVPR